IQQNPFTKEYGFYGVMGVDEFHMMVNNNCFVNYLGKKSMEFTLKVIEEMRTSAPEKLKEVENKTQFTVTELADWKEMAEKTALPKDPATGIYDQHDGYSTLPYIDINTIPITDFPLYHNWSYDRIYRTSMIKQADVLMMLFLYSQDFSKESKKVNYEYYEPRCIHESSLSPSVHSIVASEIGMHEEAYKFFQFATRLDLDDYNRNTNEGLHTTSIAAAWLNIVYGFGGMRSDREVLLFNPSIPKVWNSYSFRIIYKDSILIVSIDKTSVNFKIDGSSVVDINVYGRNYEINSTGLTLNIPVEFLA
ncbi:MAG: family 65 glycosyl hydrolase, partial [Clostridiaceae bacterium]|nr:family 65 glycosyl hydrolase [Clostridiaceae bacterium]